MSNCKELNSQLKYQMKGCNDIKYDISLRVRGTSQ